MWQAWLFVHCEDKSNLTKITLGGKEYEVSEIEALLYWYMHDESSQVKVALHDNEIVGFIIYNRVVEGILAIRLFYVIPAFHGTRVGHKLVTEIAKDKTLIFQTKKETPPDLMFKVTRGREQKLAETAKCITWFMKWENK